MFATCLAELRASFAFDVGVITRESGENTNVPNYVDESGYTVNLPARSKVGENQTKVELAIYLFKPVIWMKLLTLIFIDIMFIIL